MTGAKGSRRKRSKPDPTAMAGEEKAVIDTDHLLEEVGEANAQIADPAQRQRVVSSSLCEEAETHHHD